MSPQVDLKEGESVSISCLSDSAPVGRVVLRRAMDGMETELKASDGAETSLIFTSVELEDSGFYVCEAYNQYGSQRDSVEVIVKGEFLHGIEHVVSTVAQMNKNIITVKKKWSYLIIYNFKYSSISTYNMSIY